MYICVCFQEHCVFINITIFTTTVLIKLVKSVQETEMKTLRFCLLRIV